MSAIVPVVFSFAGVGLGEGSAETLGFKARGNRQSFKRWSDCKVLVVDEISMISGPFFDKLEAVARFNSCSRVTSCNCRR
jgi:ATP-dependent DNA helicase PIF1